jgi:hypothetical protein
MKKTKKLTPLPKLLKDAEKVFNAWVRKRALQDNNYFVCKNCSRTFPKEELNAGHLYAVKKSSFLRFHEDNVWGECRGCNAFDDNKVKYQLNLIKEIGIERVEWLNDHYRIRKTWSRDELMTIIKQYK